MRTLELVKWIPFQFGGNEDIGYESSKYLQDENISKDEMQKMTYMVLQSIVENKYCFSGEEHQSHNSNGVPLFKVGDDGYYPMTFTMRSFGDIMAQAHNTISESMKYNYMDFYMDTPEELTYNAFEDEV